MENVSKSISYSYRSDKVVPLLNERSNRPLLQDIFLIFKCDDINFSNRSYHISCDLWHYGNSCKVYGCE